MLRPEKLGRLGPMQLVHSGQMTMNTKASWQMIAFAEANRHIKFAKPPVGHESRKSLLNGLADPVFVGTNHSEEARKLVLYLDSEDCQNVVASEAVVFPAIAIADATAVDAFIHPTAFIETADDKGAMVPYPITEHATKVNKIAGDAPKRPTRY